jgi:hypothetical protein
LSRDGENVQVCFYLRVAINPKAQSESAVALKRTKEAARASCKATKARPGRIKMAAA